MGKCKSDNASKGKKPRLTPKMVLFVQNYLVSTNAAQAAIAAGYSPKTAAAMGRKLLSKPSIDDAIQRAMNERVERLHINQDMVLLELMAVVKANIGDYLTFGPGGVVFKDISEIPPEKIALIKEISQGKGGIRIALPDKLDALEKLARHLGMYEKSGQAKKRQRDFTKDVLAKFRNREVTAMEAAIDFDMEGIPIPDSVRTALARMEPEPQTTDNGEYSVISPEEMAAKAARRHAEISDQKEFVAGRKADVADLKEEMGPGSYAMQKLNEDAEE